MTLQLNNAGALTLVSKFATRSITFVLLLLASFGLSSSATAQRLQPQPVARLISEPVAESGYSRPRRVTTEASASTATSTNTASASLADANAVERRAFEQTNAARVENGLAPLTWDPELCRMARIHSRQMASLGVLSHQTPEGSQLKERARAGGILHFRVIGENIAYNNGYDDPGGFAVERWLTSSGHRANIMYAGFQSVAIGSYVGADGSTYLTQIFIAR